MCFAQIPELIAERWLKLECASSRG